MRQTTKRKYYARSNVAASLRLAAQQIDGAIKVADLPPAETPVAAELKKVLKTIEQAIEMEKLYQLGRQRIRKSLEREKKAIEQLLAEVSGVPVTKEEKLLAKRK